MNILQNSHVDTNLEHAHHLSELIEARLKKPAVTPSDRICLTVVHEASAMLHRCLQGDPDVTLNAVQERLTDAGIEV